MTCQEFRDWLFNNREPTLAESTAAWLHTTKCRECKMENGRICKLAASRLSPKARQAMQADAQNIVNRCLADPECQEMLP